jgi:hypothetical protein
MGLGGSPRFGGILLLIIGLEGRLCGILCLVFTFGVHIYMVPLLCNLFLPIFIRLVHKPSY